MPFRRRPIITGRNGETNVSGDSRRRRGPSARGGTVYKNRSPKRNKSRSETVTKLLRPIGSPVIRQPSPLSVIASVCLIIAADVLLRCGHIYSSERRPADDNWCFFRCPIRAAAPAPAMGDAHEDISFSSTTWDIINE